MTWYVEDELNTRGHDPDSELYVFLLTSHMHRHGELFEVFQEVNWCFTAQEYCLR